MSATRHRHPLPHGHPPSARLAMDAVQAANSSHPGAPMGMADIAVALWGRHLRAQPDQPALG